MFQLQREAKIFSFKKLFTNIPSDFTTYPEKNSLKPNCRVIYRERFDLSELGYAQTGLSETIFHSPGEFGLSMFDHNSSSDIEIAHLKFALSL